MHLKYLVTALSIIILGSLCFTIARSANDAEWSPCQHLNQSIRQASVLLETHETLAAVDAINKTILYVEVCESSDLADVMTRIANQSQQLKKSDALLHLAYICQATKKLSYRSEAYLTSAADLGSSEAEYALGLAYHLGQFGPYWNTQTDGSKAAFWWGKAAESGDPNAMAYLSDLYDEGDGVLQDFTQARQLRLKAASKGQGDAMFALGDMYNNGRGVRVNYMLAYMWINLAAQKEVQDFGFQNPVTIRERDKASAHLSSTGLLKAQSISRICLEFNYKQCEK